MVSSHKLDRQCCRLFVILWSTNVPCAASSGNRCNVTGLQVEMLTCEQAPVDSILVAGWVDHRSQFLQVLNHRICLRAAVIQQGARGGCISLRWNTT